MDVFFIESKINEIIAELEKEVMEVISDQSLDKKQTNLRMKPLKSTKQILVNAIDSIKMVEEVSKKEMEDANQ
ncbi:hypothetical protein PGH07_07020 [Sulfurovum sp. zt1-1]|uniref:Uncharacterized protein n=1 Tax=Sulfurovum zhangzhouensis TaxID=3019067 RepID=A0ABT7QYL5_9BACT|nr:hypothetical protein [Sulfurovum zhangzhouensis]MDM5271925.1 hypothetical protein [Sulfurovum zhangzhouensis]